jgi:nitric oxide reductase NorD protein
VAGTGTRLPLAQIDADVLALPACVSVFDSAALNRDLYLWWAALAGAVDPAAGWVDANAVAAAATLERFPGLHARWQRLCEAELGLRSHDAAPTVAERQVRAALTGARDATGTAQAADVAPVWCWLLPCAAQGARLDAADPAADSAGSAQADTLPGRRRATALPQHRARAPLLLASKAEALRTFADPMAIDRADDDTDDGSDRVAADELETLSMQRSTSAQRAARVRFDLDLPSAAADDLPAGDGEWLPEWDPKSHRVEPRRVRTQPLQARAAMPWRRRPHCMPTRARVRQPPAAAARCAALAARLRRRRGDRHRRLGARRPSRATGATPAGRAGRRARPAPRPTGCTSVACATVTTWRRCCWPTCRFPPTRMSTTTSA